MNTVDMPPSYLRNRDVVYVESLREGTTAHVTPACPSVNRATTGVTAVVAWVHLHAQWCGRCMGRRS